MPRAAVTVARILSGLRQRNTTGSVSELLLAHGADPNRPAFAGLTPLDVATVRGYSDLVELLRRAGGQPSQLPGLRRHPTVFDRDGHQGDRPVVSTAATRTCPPGPRLRTGGDRVTQRTLAASRDHRAARRVDRLRTITARPRRRAPRRRREWHRRPRPAGPCRTRRTRSGEDRRTRRRDGRRRTGRSVGRVQRDRPPPQRRPAVDGTRRASRHHHRGCTAPSDKPEPPQHGHQAVPRLDRLRHSTGRPESMASDQLRVVEPCRHTADGNARPAGPPRR